jgi:hypothetical protein
MRYIHQIFTPTLGERWENHRVLSEFEGAIARLEIDEAQREKLL